MPLHELRSAIDEATVVLNTAVTERQITSGLQLERLTILRDRGLPISYLGTGQSVPEHLELATGAAIAAWVTGDADVRKEAVA